MDDIVVERNGKTICARESVFLLIHHLLLLMNCEQPNYVWPLRDQSVAFRAAVVVIC